MTAVVETDRRGRDRAATDPTRRGPAEFSKPADDVVAWNIEQIRELGIDIEIDDFGTGHTSILSLLKLKPQRLKIDRQLVAPIVS